MVVLGGVPFLTSEVPLYYVATKLGLVAARERCALLKKAVIFLCEHHFCAVLGGAG